MYYLILSLFFSLFTFSFNTVFFFLFVCRVRFVHELGGAGWAGNASADALVRRRRLRPPTPHRRRVGRRGRVQLLWTFGRHREISDSARLQGEGLLLDRRGELLPHRLRRARCRSPDREFSPLFSVPVNFNHFVS